MSTIKAGYRVTVVSWENDADNYNTITRDGLSVDEVKLHVDLLKLISSSNCNDKTVFGNMYEPDDEELLEFEKAASQVLTKHNKVTKYDTLDYVMDILGDYTGYSDGFYTRVAESVTVEFVPVEIDIKDVSGEFGL